MRKVWLVTWMLPLWLWAQSPIEPVGRWKIFHSDGAPIWVEVKADGSCSSDWGKGEKGRWKLDQGSLLLDWSDGWRDIISVEGKGLKKAGYAPGVPLTGKPSNRTAAYKIKD